MHKLITITAIISLASGITGCQTSILAEKHAEQVLPIEQVVKINGQDQVITTDYLIASGGWHATARSPLYATEALNGLEIGVHTNGSVTLALAKYSRDLSTNSVAMTREMFAGGANLVTAIGDAYVKIAGGGAQADAVIETAKRAYNLFSSSGGDPAKAVVTTSSSGLQVSDGSVCVTCDPAGNCSTCTDCIPN